MAKEPKAGGSGKTVDGYVAGLEPRQAEIVSALRTRVREAAPDAKESIKWAQPVFEDNGPFCYLKAHQRHVNIGFWRGAELPDPDGLLEGEGEHMKHMKVASLAEIRGDAVQAFVREAVRLNRTLGTPTKRKA